MIGTTYARVRLHHASAVLRNHHNLREFSLFHIESKGFLGRRRRLVAEEELSSADFRIIANQLGQPPRPARKIVLVAARCATRVASVETRWNGKETRNRAAPGDWIVTNLSQQGE